MKSLSGVVSSLALAFQRLIFVDSRLEGLRVTVVGLQNHVSRDTARYLVGRGVKVTVVGQAGEVELLRRDLELVKTQVNLDSLDTFDEPEIRLMTENLLALGRLPQIIACCCGGGDCPTSILVPLMQPSLVLHLSATRSMDSGRGGRSSAARTLASLLADSRLFDPAQAPSKVRLGLNVFDVSRRHAYPGGGAPRRQPCAVDRTASQPDGVLRPTWPTRPAVRSRKIPPLLQGDQG